MYRNLILFSRHGKIRLTKYFINVPEKERNKLNYEVVQIALNRNTSYANIFHHRGVTYCYKRYASLFFLIGISEDENEMIALMFLHRIVEAMDKYFGNVCELDVIFNFERVHAIVDELLMAGQIQETSLKEVNKVSFWLKIWTRIIRLIQAVCNADSIQEEELNSDGWWNIASVWLFDCLFHISFNTNIIITHSY